VHEREEDLENSVVCLARAEDCCKRAVGTYTEETVAIMIELLRVLIKCETPEGYPRCHRESHRADDDHRQDRGGQEKGSGGGGEEKKRTFSRL
jgi:hypothetical protein